MQQQQEEEPEQLQIKQIRRVVLIGESQGGKSTLNNVLSRGMKDDGNGSAIIHSKQIHKLGQDLIGFDKVNNQVLPHPDESNMSERMRQVLNKSSNIITLYDLPGQSLKTVVYMLNALSPHAVILVLSPNSPVPKLHLMLSHYLQIPTIAVITKSDLLDPTYMINQLKDSLMKLKVPFVIDANCTRLEQASLKMNSNSFVPIFTVSNINRNGIDKLLYFLSRMSVRPINIVNQTMWFDIVDTMPIKSQVLLDGVLKMGTILKGHTCYLGPDLQGKWKQLIVQSIHCFRQPVNQVHQGLPASLLCGVLNEETVKKGTILTSVEHDVCMQFEANVSVFQQATSIEKGFMATLLCGCLKQQVEVVSIFNKNVLRSGMVGTIRLRLMERPAVLMEKQYFILMEGDIKLFGQITNIISTRQLELENEILK